jgi:hypothetical protein
MYFSLLTSINLIATPLLVEVCNVRRVWFAKDTRGLPRFWPNKRIDSILLNNHAQLNCRVSSRQAVMVEWCVFLANCVVFLYLFLFRLTNEFCANCKRVIVLHIYCARTCSVYNYLFSTLNETKMSKKFNWKASNGSPCWNLNFIYICSMQSVCIVVVFLR